MAQLKTGLQLGLEVFIFNWAFCSLYRPLMIGRDGNGSNLNRTASIKGRFGSELVGFEAGLKFRSFRPAPTHPTLFVLSYILSAIPFIKGYSSKLVGVAPHPLHVHAFPFLVYMGG